ILSSFFGSTTASGTLEIRPLTTTSTTGGLTTSATSAAPVTVASSRTYNQTATGTFGQYIPAIPFSQFIGKSSSEGARTVLSLQQIAQSQAFRTNLGLVEGSGEPASVLLSVFDGAGKKVGEIPVSLLPGEHRQINSILEANGITLTDGRIEVEVTSDTGKVTAYASTVDNRTNDPLLVSPVPRAAQTSTKFVLPGMADLPEPNDFRSDIRLFNAGSSSITVTPAYYAQGSTAPRSGQPLTIAPGEVKAIDDVLPTLFGVTSSGGSIVLTTSEPAALVATGRTFSTDANGGTYGQFIPGVTPDESAVLGGRALQILQLEHSSRFRTNIGLAETSGNAATVEVSVTLPDSKVTPKVTIPLAANEFRQISLGDFGLTDVYNARVTVKVVAGSGRVAAYGSVIDQVTADPTYVPAQ
ncbi:MAG TPA: DUF5719 family protein, partial [Thermoanaerobaculia bacterium]|nr:DUF5719 family protein [Thermoanaerobaculia bacterium]